MRRYLREGRVGEYRLENFEINSSNAGFRNPIPHGKYIALKRGNTVVMSDTPMEKRTNKEIVMEAHGDVLIGGLGMGMILMMIQDKAEVRSITVVEKSREVIELVGRQLPLNSKVKVVEGDIKEWVVPRGLRYDIIYFDIWDYVNTDVYEEMKMLKKRYRGRLKPKKESPGSRIFCWAEYEAKNNLRLY